MPTPPIGGFPPSGKALSLALLFMLAACKPPVTYYKPGASSEHLAHDTAQCKTFVERTQAQLADKNQQWRSDAYQEATRRMDPDLLFDRCMHIKGWVQESDEIRALRALRNQSIGNP